MDRRGFLRGTTAALAGITSQILGAESTESFFPIIDTHQHLWDLKQFRLPWIKPGTFLAHNFLLKEYAQATADLGLFPPGPGQTRPVPGRIVQTIYLEVDVDPTQQLDEVRYVAELCRRADTLVTAAVVSGRPASEGFGRYLDAFKNVACIKGIRQVLHGEGTPPGTCLDPSFVKGIQLLGERGLSFDLCMRPTDLRDAAKLIDQCPGTRFILDHCGNGPIYDRKTRLRWQRDIVEVARKKNVAVKISGIIVQAEPKTWKPDDLAPIINHTMEVFGPDRVMFGGDWPVCTKAATYKQWVESLKTIVASRPYEEQRKLFHDNALRIYRLE